ncbi:MAG TPA: efflux RND transporter periplasmic adaptor subunit [Polyangia bacterium]|nr:efflux RND transporter periplasmic adaptor subunit [Polyangia bacterium]
MTPDSEMTDAPPKARSRLPLGIGAGVLVILLIGGLMMWRADARTNKVALSSGPKPVTVVRAKATTYRPTRTYVGTLQPWVQANVGPQLVSAYVDTVLVRPGAIVKKGEVIATLDCREASASTKAIAARARALDARQQAVEHEASRTQGLLDGGFVSPNEAEQKTAQSTSEAAQVESERANLARSSLEVNDCIMRAPFNSEVAQRSIDPGAFVRPGNTIVTVVDRDTVRMTADAPETDFDVVGAGTKVSVHVYATKKDFPGTVTRRSPAADASTRTVHFEIDLPDPERLIPVGTTGEVHIQVGAPVPATEVPLYAATVRGSKATVFVVDQGIAHAHTVPVEGEAGGSLFLDPSLAAGTPVVTEGRALLEDGDQVLAKESTDASGTPSPSASQVAERAPASRRTPLPAATGNSPHEEPRVAQEKR